MITCNHLQRQLRRGIHIHPPEPTALSLVNSVFMSWWTVCHTCKEIKSSAPLRSLSLLFSNTVGLLHSNTLPLSLKVQFTTKLPNHSPLRLLHSHFKTQSALQEATVSLNWQWGSIGCCWVMWQSFGRSPWRYFDIFFKTFKDLPKNLGRYLKFSNSSLTH